MQSTASEAREHESAWLTFYRTVEEAVKVLNVRLTAIPPDADGSHPGVRTLQRARRRTWLFARHSLGLSMFQSIRIAERLAEEFAAWTRAEGRDLDSLADRLRGVEREAREPGTLAAHEAFIGKLQDASRCDAHSDPMEVVLAAYRAAQGERRAAGLG